MKYLLEVLINQSGAVGRAYVNPDVQTLGVNWPGLVVSQEEAKRYDTEEQARGAIDGVLKLVDESFARRDVKYRERYLERELSRIRQQARVIPLDESKFVIRYELINLKGSCYSPCYHCPIEGQPAMISALSLAKMYDTDQEARDALPSMIEANRLKMVGFGWDQEKINEHLAEVIATAEVLPV